MIKGLEKIGIRRKTESESQDERPAKRSRLDNGDVITANQTSITHTQEDSDASSEVSIANDTCTSTPAVSTPPSTCESRNSVEIGSDTIPMATRVCGFPHLNHDLLPSVLLPASKWKEHIDLSQINESCSSTSSCVNPELSASEDLLDRLRHLMDKKDRDRHAAESSYEECQEELAELKVDYRELQEVLEWKEGIEVELKEVKEELRSLKQREEERRERITVLEASGFDTSFLENDPPTPRLMTKDDIKLVNEVGNPKQELEGYKRKVTALEERAQSQEEDLVKMRLKHSKTNEKLGEVVMEKDGLLKELETLRRRLEQHEEDKGATSSTSGSVVGRSNPWRETEVIDLSGD